MSGGMFTLSMAREAIGNSSYFARGWADALQKRVMNAKLRLQNGEAEYSATVVAGGGEYDVSFVYDVDFEDFSQMICTCPEGRYGMGCRHAAALMIAVCTGAVDPEPEDDSGEFLNELIAMQAAVPRLHLRLE